MTRPFVLALLLVGCAPVGCARGAAPAEPPRDAGRDPAAALDGCVSETRDGATTWSCGEAFLALDADVGETATDAAIEANLGEFERSFGKDVTARDPSDWLVRGRRLRALRIRVAMPEKGRFVATMVIVPRGDRTRVISCSAREVEAARCDDAVAFLVGRATP